MQINLVVLQWKCLNSQNKIVNTLHCKCDEVYNMVPSYGAFLSPAYLHSYL